MRFKSHKTRQKRNNKNLDSPMKHIERKLQQHLRTFRAPELLLFVHVPPWLGRCLLLFVQASAGQLFEEKLLPELDRQLSEPRAHRTVLLHVCSLCLGHSTSKQTPFFLLDHLFVVHEETKLHNNDNSAKVLANK